MSEKEVFVKLGGILVVGKKKGSASAL